MQNGTKTFGATLVALAIVAVWVTHAVGQPEPATAIPAGSTPASKLPPGCLQVVSEPGRPLVAVVYDPQQQVLGVYHIDRATGEIELKSIRQIEWDLQMLHFNPKEPLPEQIKNDLENLRRP